MTDTATILPDLEGMPARILTVNQTATEHTDVLIMLLMVGPIQKMFFHTIPASGQIGMETDLETN